MTILSTRVQSDDRRPCRADLPLRNRPSASSNAGRLPELGFSHHCPTRGESPRERKSRRDTRRHGQVGALRQRDKASGVEARHCANAPGPILGGHDGTVHRVDRHRRAVHVSASIDSSHCDCLSCTSERCRVRGLLHSRSRPKQPARTGQRHRDQDEHESQNHRKWQNLSPFAANQPGRRRCSPRERSRPRPDPGREGRPDRGTDSVGHIEP